MLWFNNVFVKLLNLIYIYRLYMIKIVVEFDLFEDRLNNY